MYYEGDMPYVDRLFGVFQPGTARMNSRAPASGWPACTASSPGTATGPGPRDNLTAVRHFTLRCRSHTKGGEMKVLKRILLVEDDPMDMDIELTLAALAEHNLANEVAVARDGVEALDYLLRRGSFVQRPPGIPSDRQ